MSLISSETLFNFTDTLEHLLSNLENGFHCHPTSEDLPWQGYSYIATITCFCDIPLSLISDHFKWYGSYGIGIKREYARSLGVQPVWYVIKENTDIREQLLSIAQGKNENSRMPAYYKKFLGYQEFPALNERKMKKFYDEREWRFVHPENDVVTFSSGKKANDVSRIRFQARKMAIDLDAIEYIIIESVDDLSSLLKALKKLATSDNALYESLVTKILTARQIRNDF